MVKMLFDNRCRLVTSTKPNATAVFAGMNGAAPTGGYINPEAIHDPTTGVAIATNDTVPYCAFVDNLFECGIGTIDTTAHTLTRAAATISNSSGTQVRIDFSGASANPTIICSWDAVQGTSSFNLNRREMYGLEMSAPSNVTLAASAGCAWIEGMNGAPLSVAALATITPTLAASTYYNVFAFVSSGALTLEAVSGGAAGSTNPPVAFAVPAGNARSKTGDTSRRWLGTILTDASSHIRPFLHRELGGGLCEVIYLADTSAAAPFKLLTAGAAGTFTAVDASGVAPNNGTVLELFVNVSCNITAGAGAVIISVDGVGYSALINSAATGSMQLSWWQPVNAATTAALYYKIGGSTTADLYCWGYRYRR